jgi:glutamyl-tRNA synthetase
MPAYELAVVVDDADMRITEVVRGEDLLLSTARQLLLYTALELTAPNFFHETLVLDESGERLAKQKDSLALRTLYAQGHDLESIRKMWVTRS